MSETIVMRDQGGDPAVATTSEAASTRRLLLAWCALLAGFALLLTAASLAGDRMRPPLDRIAAATYAAERGIAFSTAPATLSGDRPAARAGSASVSTGRRASVPGTASPTLQASIDANPLLVAEVKATYLRAWELWAEACFTLDPAPLERVFARPELDRVHVYVRQLRASGRALRLDAAHRVTVIALDGDTALLLDDLTDRSLYLDPATRQPLPPDAQPTPVGSERVYCRLRRTAAGWRVEDITWGR